MKPRFLTAAVLGLFASAHGAIAACTDHAEGEAVVASQARAAILWGNYERFALLLDPEESKWTEQIAKLTKSLQTGFEGGFDGCEVLVRRQLSPVMYQDISVFTAEGKELIFFYFLAAKIDGTERVLNFRVSSDPTEMIRELR